MVSIAAWLCLLGRVAFGRHTQPIYMHIHDQHTYFGIDYPGRPVPFSHVFFFTYFPVPLCGPMSCHVMSCHVHAIPCPSILAASSANPPPPPFPSPDPMVHYGGSISSLRHCMYGCRGGAAPPPLPPSSPAAGCLPGKKGADGCPDAQIPAQMRDAMLHPLHHPYLPPHPLLGFCRCRCRGGMCRCPVPSGTV